MVLIQSSFPSSIEAGLPSLSDHGKQEFLRVWIPGDGTQQECTECDKHPQGGHVRAVPITAWKIKDNNSCPPNFLSCSQLSTATTMSESSTPTFVYKRRKIQRNPSMSESSTPTFVYKRRKIQRNPSAVFPSQASTNTRPCDNYFSASSSEAISVAAKEHTVSYIDVDDEVLIASDLLPVECGRLDLASKSGSVDGASLGVGPAIAEDPKNDMRKGLDFCAINDSCSSAKSNVDLGSASLKPDVDDAGECSSSGALMLEGLEEDLCISLLRSHGALKGIHPIKIHASAESMDIKKNSSCFLSCQVCDQLEMTPKMLICDHCEEAFHVSCCNPPMKEIPVDEWFCHSCLRKKLKKLKETSTSNSGRQKTVVSKDESGPIAFMLRDTEPYTTNVRIGRDYQAEVPDWSGPNPIANEVDDFAKPVEMTLLECASYQAWNSNKPSRLSSIGNWLQCQEIIDSVDGTICGKWRRAPLFEVQTDDWECFRSVLWDSTHSDCAVPQELHTDQVLKHLKYIYMLRPRLTAKRCKLGIIKASDSQEHPQDLRNTQTS